MSEKRKQIGAWLKAKGTAIGVAIGAGIVATGDYLCGDCGLIPWIVEVAKHIFSLT